MCCVVGCGGLQADEISILRHVLTCTCSLLMTLEAAHWKPAASAHRSSASALAAKLFQALLVYCADPRPKLRKAAQEQTTALMAALAHPKTDSAAAVSSSAQQQTALPAGLISVFEALATRELSRCTPQNCTVALYWCGLLQSVVGFLPAPTTASIIQTILKYALLCVALHCVVLKCHALSRLWCGVMID
jgi:hypothetical protein